MAIISFDQILSRGQLGTTEIKAILDLFVYLRILDGDSVYVIARSIIVYNL